MNEKEREEIINAAVERAMLALPETVGHLITNHMSMMKLNEEFYTEHPEFKERKDVVAAVMEMVEGENPLAEYKDLLAKAVPKIKERLVIVKDIDMTTVNRTPNRDFSSCGEL